MKELRRINIYSYMREGVVFKELNIEFWKELFIINHILLKNIEDFFPKNEISYEKKKTSKTMKENLEKNTQELIDTRFKFIDISNLIKESKKITENWYKKSTKVENLFNRIVKVLIKFSNEVLEIHYLTEMRNLKGMVQNKYNDEIGFKRVFLSYAYEDLTYTIALFFYLYEHNILLYIDWMHNEAIDDGIILKDSLNTALSSSEQLLFLRSINSELNIGGFKSIRKWCSWEVGNFYSNSTGNNTQKYFLNLYGELPLGNLHLHGFSLLDSISNSRLIGKRNW